MPFIYMIGAYTTDDTYDGQTVTQVWSGTDVTETPNDYYPGFKFVTHDDCTKIIFDESFVSVLPNSCHGWFDGFHKLATIEGIEYLNTSEVTDMGYMFADCYELSSLDLSSFNLAKVTTVNNMFIFSRELKTIYVSNDWTIDSDTPSGAMFYGCTNLVGGQGTTYNEDLTSKKYARIDGGKSNPGYFTLKADGIALDENSDGNSSTINANNGEIRNVTLARTIVPGSYNTLCLPFDVNNDMLKYKFGDDVELAQLSDTHMENGTLYFDFTLADAITAGVPYLIYVSDAVESPITFNAVTVKKETQPVTTSLAKFVPVFDVTTLQNGNENILFLGANNTLYYPSTTSGAMKGFRAYFEVKGEAQGAKAMVMMDNSLTGVKTILNENLQNEQVYDLQGRMLTRPAKGLYIMNGKKVIIK